jgi:heme exporter protein C
MIQSGKPRRHSSDRSAISVFAAVILLLMVLAQSAVWFYAPVERSLGPVQKIFYMHLPLAWWAFVAFFLVFVGSIGYLWRRSEAFDHLAAASAEIGVLFSTLVLLTGMLWARASWNTWWTWDPRLSTALVMWFIYCGYLVLRNAAVREKGKLLCAVLGIVAFADVPLVFLSARLLRSIHPAVIADKRGGLPEEMWLTLLVCLAAWGGLFAVLLRLRVSQVALKAGLDMACRDR